MLHLSFQFWTTRGFAVVDVNYRGSTGYGRAYRDLLQGQWGDRRRRGLRGGLPGSSSSGAMSTRPGCASGVARPVVSRRSPRWRSRTLRAGASHYGVADLGALARDTHKFECRYLDGLVGPWPEARDVYEARSPIFHVDGIDRPLVVFQGLEDEVVPPTRPR